MINVAILGYGVVGSGVAEVIRKNAKSIERRAGDEIKVKYILDIRDFPDSPDADVLVKDAEQVFNDPSVSIIVETIGGARIAQDFTRRALLSGRHVVTSNKELVAAHGPELLRIAAEKGVNYLFEASVGGGIPIIRPLYECLAANEINSIMGILNGTTNYILTKMSQEGKDFSEALKGAQANGYAEANPTADVEGHDACRKIAILSSIAYGEYVDFSQIHTEGITKITSADMHYASELSCVIKLVGMSVRAEGGIYSRVAPVMISRNHALANVEDVFNAILVDGNAIGEVMFYGRGAGKLPTASAVVGDIIDIAKNVEQNNNRQWRVPEKQNVLPFAEMSTRYFIRLAPRKASEAQRAIREIFGSCDFIKLPAVNDEDEIAFTTECASEGSLAAKVEELKGKASIREIGNVIRMM